MKILRTERLVLEPLNEAHASEMFRILIDPILYTYLHERPPFTEDELRARYRFLERRRSPDGANEWLSWVLRGPGGEAYGYVSAIVHGRGAADLSVLVTPRMWRQGFAREAVAKAIAELKSSRGATSFFATVSPRNDQAISLLQHLGFRPVSRSEFDVRAVENDHLVFVNGRIADGSGG
jgi:RimJ/RimL family protein N-acetyltransferase